MRADSWPRTAPFPHQTFSPPYPQPHHTPTFSPPYPEPHQHLSSSNPSHHGSPLKLDSSYLSPFIPPVAMRALLCCCSTVQPPPPPAASRGTGQPSGWQRKFLLIKLQPPAGFLLEPPVGDVTSREDFCSNYCLFLLEPILIFATILF